MVYATRGLVDVLLDLAADADPDPVSTGVSAIPADDLAGAGGLPAETPVFTDFVLPDVGRSVTAVFGLELSTPAPGTPGRFVSHPVGELEVTKADVLAQVVFVATPPWGPDPDVFGAFDRSGDRLPLEIVDASPPVESFAARTRDADAHSR